VVSTPLVMQAQKGAGGVPLELAILDAKGPGLRRYWDGLI
jgi:hypothetical protein